MQARIGEARRDRDNGKRTDTVMRIRHPGPNKSLVQYLFQLINQPNAYSPPSLTCRNTATPTATTFLSVLLLWQLFGCSTAPRSDGRARPVKCPWPLKMTCHVLFWTSVLAENAHNFRMVVAPIMHFLKTLTTTKRQERPLIYCRCRGGVAPVCPGGRCQFCCRPNSFGGGYV